MSKIEVAIPYIGSVISVNHAYIHGRFLRPAAKSWRDVLAMIVKMEMAEKEIGDLTPPLTVMVEGRFRNWRSAPDLHNLHKLIADAVQMATRINDKHIRMADGERWASSEEPMIFVEISDRSG